MQDKIKTLTLDFFEKLNINIDSLDVTKDSSKNVFTIDIKSNESLVLIWPNWINIDAIQNILKIINSKNIGENIKINLKINNYSKTKDDRLYDFIDKEIIYLKKIGNDIKLPYYSAYERKKIHSYIAYKKDSSIWTKSIWEWKNRRIYLCIKTEKLTIDIDWNDI